MKLLFLLIPIFIFSFTSISFQQEENDANPTDPWMLDYAFLKEIILVLIPTIIGAYTSKYLTNRWQTNKDKAEIKKTIQIEVDNSLLRYIMILINLNRKIWDYYNEITLESEHSKDKIKHVKLNFPKDPNEFPSHKFKKEISETFDELGKMDEKIWKCRSSISLYYADKSLKNTFQVLEIALNPIRLDLQKFLLVKTPEKFDQYHESFWEKSIDFQNKIYDFKEKLLNAKISVEK